MENIAFDDVLPEEPDFSSYRRRGSFYKAEQLKQEEVAFLDFVRDANLLELQKLVKSFPSLNVNCCDIRGHRALEIAVQNMDTEMAVELLHLDGIDVEHLYSAVLIAIFENDITLLNILLHSFPADKAAKERPDSFPNIAVNNTTPLMAAAIVENLEIIKLLLDKGHTIQKPHDPSCRCKTQCCIEDSPCGEGLSRSQVRKNAYRALASPTYIILTSDDPVLTAFELSRELEKIARATPEFRSDYIMLSHKCSTFAASLLDQCKDTTEVQTVLMQNRGFPDSRPFRFPRLYLAILLEQKAFVAHPNCQQVLRSLWIEGLPSWASWSSKRRMLHVAIQALLAPFLCFCYLIIPKAHFFDSFRVPLNRFIYNCTSYAIFLLLLMVSLFYGRRDSFRLRALWVEVLIGTWVAGYVWETMVNLCALGPKIFLRSSWSVYDLVMYTMFLVAELLWFGVFVSARTMHEGQNRDSWPWYHPYLLGEGIYAVASVLAFCRLLLWSQMHPSIGPLGISLKYMVGDVIRFLLIIFIVFFAFGAGLNSIYKNYDGNVLYFGDGRMQEQPPYFTSIRKTLKSLFWAIYSMGDPDYADLVVAGNASANGTKAGERHHYFTEMIGYALWAMYHVVTVVILLNILIAMMSNSFQRVQSNAYLEWMFARSSQWLAFFDLHSSIPPPFNLLPTARCFKATGGLFKSIFSKEARKAAPCTANNCCFGEWEQERSRHKKQQLTYRKLIVNLVRRYLQKQELLERDLSTRLSCFRPDVAAQHESYRDSVAGARHQSVQFRHFRQNSKP